MTFSRNASQSKLHIARELNFTEDLKKSRKVSEVFLLNYYLDSKKRELTADKKQCTKRRGILSSDNDETKGCASSSRKIGKFMFECVKEIFDSYFALVINLKAPR